MYHDVGGIVSLYIDEVQWHTFLDHFSISLHLDSSACSPLSDYIYYVLSFKYVLCILVFLIMLNHCMENFSYEFLPFMGP